MSLILSISAFGWQIGDNNWPTLPLDVHVHHDHEDPGGDWALKSNKVEKALLISSSYRIKTKYCDPDQNPKRWDCDLSLRAKMNEDLSTYMRQHPDRFRGLCGSSILWEPRELTELTLKCLSLPNMIGLKLHTWDDGENLYEEQNWEKVDAFFKDISQKKPVVLWHIRTYHLFHWDDPEKAAQARKKEYKALADLVSKHKDITFVIAHALEAHDISYFASLAKNLSNLYLELSVPFIGAHDLSLDPQIVNGWKIFGLDRILFGTDTGFFREDAYDIYESAFNRTDLLSAKEKQQILIDNSKSFLKNFWK